MRELLAASRVSGLWAAALVVICSACKPDLPQTPTEKVVTAVFDPTTATIPLPNDLVFPPFNSNLNSVCPPGSNAPSSTPGCAQAELLATFGGAFPNDQEVAITIDFSQVDLHSNGVQTTAAPELDFSSFTSTTFFVATVNGTTVTVIPTEPPTAADYTRFADHGTLTIHHKGHLPWAPGKYAVLLRGGPDGVKTADGTPVAASQIFALIAQGKDLTDPANLGLLRAQTGSLDAAIAQGTQLNLLINLVYKPTAFVAADTRFPHTELAIASTFTINSSASVVVDAARGLVPLPIDLLRDATGHISALAACTFARAKLNPDGTCPSPLAGGFQALDGFSTTGPLLIPTSGVVLASSVRTAGAVRLFDISKPAQPVQVSPADYIAQPCEFAFVPGPDAEHPGPGCVAGALAPGALATAIALQPAGATTGEPGGGVFRTKPLKDNTDYAVLITNAVQDASMKPLGAGTVGSILRFKNPISVGGKSQLLGVDDATAAGLEHMRLQLQPVIAALPTADQAKVAMAYTFHTQSIVTPALKLSALPYALLPPPQQPVPLAEPNVLSPAGAFQKWGVDPAVVPSGNIEEILEVDIETLNALDPITGAFMSDPTKAPKERIHVLIATPKAANVPSDACLGGTSTCAPMMIFRHGLRSGRGAMLLVADRFAAKGMVTVAIDAAKHGDRSFCTSGPASATTGCFGGAACTTLLPSGAQGDEHPPGSCGAAGFIKRPISPTCAQDPFPCPAFTDGTPAVSGNYLTSANLFRTRDTLRQDLIDQSQLIRAIAFVPAAGAPVNSVFQHMLAHNGIVIDPGKIFYTGQSLGAIQGAVDVATNPRISKAAFNVGGGTIMDIFTQSLTFKAETDALLAQLGITTKEQLAQFLVVAKTILDPADPINFVGHLTKDTLPNLLAPTPALQATKQILTQFANCDAVVPNPFNYIFASNVPTSPLPPAPNFGTPGTFEIFVPTGPADLAAACSVSTAVPHGFLTDWSLPFAGIAQNDIANFVMAGTQPPSIQHP